MKAGIQSIIATSRGHIDYDVTRWYLSQPNLVDGIFKNYIHQRYRHTRRQLRGLRSQSNVKKKDTTLWRGVLLG